MFYECPHLVLSQEDHEPSAFDFEASAFSTWSKGWHDNVYNDNSERPDITLGEMLLMYFEWMSVHQVTFVLVHALLLVRTAITPVSLWCRSRMQQPRRFTSCSYCCCPPTPTQGRGPCLRAY
jgi:hypothetical protein